MCGGQMQRLRAVGKLLAVSDNDLTCACWEWGDRLLVHDGIEEELYKSSVCRFIAIWYEYLGPLSYMGMSPQPGTGPDQNSGRLSPIR